MVNNIGCVNKPKLLDYKYSSQVCWALERRIDELRHKRVKNIALVLQSDINSGNIFSDEIAFQINNNRANKSPEFYIFEHNPNIRNYLLQKGHYKVVYEFVRKE